MRIDRDLTFQEIITIMCSKANKKFHALTRVFKYMGLQKCRILMKSFYHFTVKLLCNSLDFP